MLSDAHSLRASVCELVRYNREFHNRLMTQIFLLSEIQLLPQETLRLVSTAEDHHNQLLRKSCEVYQAKKYFGQLVGFLEQCGPQFLNVTLLQPCDWSYIIKSLRTSPSEHTQRL